MTESQNPATDEIDFQGRRIVRKKPAKQLFTAVILQLESFVVLFIGLAASKLTTADNWLVWTITGVLFFTLITAARMVSKRNGYLIGSFLQGVLLAVSFLIRPWFLAAFSAVVVAVFITLWAVSLKIGQRIDEERLAYDLEHPEEAPYLTE